MSLDPNSEHGIPGDRMRPYGLAHIESASSNRLGFAAGASVIALAVYHGGYSPTAWGWGSVACLWVAFLALVMRRPLEIDRVLITWVGALLTLIAWTSLSATWSLSTPRTMLEVERGLLYLAALAGLALVSRRGDGRQLVFGIATGTAAVVIGALGYYLLAPSAVDATQAQLLFRPVGYANALGGLIAIGVPLLLGISTATRRLEVAAAAAAAAVLSVVALYLTQNRSGWLALATALVVWLLTTSAASEAALAIAVTAIPAGVAISIVAYLDLLRTDRPAGRTAHAYVAAAAVVFLAASGSLATLLRPRLHLRPRTVVRAAQGGAIAVSAALVWAAAGAVQGDRGHYWRAAVHGIEHHWLFGSGAGTFDEVWFRFRDVDRAVRDAHNLYLETLTELGPAGLLLIVVFLAMPLIARGARREPLSAAARGAYCAFLVHAGFEWDWEMPIVTLPALALGTALLLARDPSAVPRVGPVIRLAGATVVAMLTLFAVDALAGNAYLIAAERHANAGDDVTAQSRATRASHLLPWASEPWLVISDLRARSGDAAGARAALRNAASRDRSDWSVWYRLAVASDGNERATAVRRVSALNPRLVRRP